MHLGFFSTISLGCEDGVTVLVVQPKLIPALCRLGENPARKVKILEVDFVKFGTPNGQERGAADVLLGKVVQPTLESRGMRVPGCVCSTDVTF